MFCTWGALSWWACSAYFIHTWFMLSEWNAFGGMYKLGWCGKGIWIVPNRVAMLDAWNCSSVRLRAYYKDDIICCTAYKQEFMLLFFPCSALSSAKQQATIFVCSDSVRLWQWLGRNPPLNDTNPLTDIPVQRGRKRLLSALIRRFMMIPCILV